MPGSEKNLSMETLKLGVLGCGRMVRHHVKQIREMDDAEIVALCDVSVDIADAFRKENFDDEPVRCFDDADQMYDEGGIQGVLITTPHTLHFEQAMRALDAGCHVFVEKPMVTKSEDGKRLKDKVQETGKVLTVGYNTPCRATFGRLREMIRGGRRGGHLGPLELVSGYLVQNWMNGTTGTWRQDPALSGGGQAYDSGAHMFASLVWSVESKPAKVVSYVDNHGRAVDINSVTSIRFQNGVMANITIGGNCATGGSHMTFIFEKGRVEIDGWVGSTIKIYHAGGTDEPDLSDEDVTPIQNFVDAVHGKAEPKTTAQTGIYLSELMDAIYQSEESGKIVTVND